MEFTRKRADSQWYHGVCENVSEMELNQWGEIDLDYICKRCRLVNNCNFDYSQGLSRLKKRTEINIMRSLFSELSVVEIKKASAAPRECVSTVVCYLKWFVVF
ncbi:hypothetical protein DPMN_194070 [Dreissena polymorpha]|uniref:Uncharacterized protein n=1 Tax=Dreissena polymorpha TaxID=45954 RepID=A0A9D3Y379_DREPO|nr:hypothetical protein DPMN_194070 [Dreissena polymorpha]